ncbi:MAG: DUF58 domain-containing protein [Candidatus Thermoplasmatota archaeon]|nr:DUF58 domain-containing protein [Candidatus Thermoplasmatota archaeon]MBS3790275.1 DUF58 domain-containing protein [Candidatus Thermoplasmatota archaeon]
MKTRNFGYLFALFFVTITLGMMFMNYIFFIPALTSLSIMIVGYLDLPPDDEDITVERRQEEVHTYEGEEFTVGLTVKNHGDSKAFLEIKDELSTNVKVIKGSNHHSLYLEPGEEKEIEYKIKFLKTENYRIGPVKARYIDPMGLFSKDWMFEEFMNAIALPPVEELSRTKLRPKYTRGWLGNIKSSQMGVGSEFFSIREYLQGDEMRDINWKATARYLDPKSNAFEAEKSGDVIIVVDAFYDSNVGVFEDNMLKHSVRAATTLASDIISDRNRVGLLVIGDFVRWVYPKSGQEQLYEVMDNLMNLEGGSHWRLEHAKFIMDNIFPNRCLLLFISPLTTDKVTEAIAGLARKKYEIAVVSPCPVELQKKYIDREDELAEKLHRIERKNRMTELRDYGPVIDWNTDQPLEVAIEGVRRYQVRK